MTFSSVTQRVTEYGSLISPVRDRNRPIYNWHAFKHSYSKNLVEKLVKTFNLEKGSWVLDPFCGGGTTLLACKELGINSMGFDILPFSVFLSSVKVKTYEPQALKQQLRHFSRSGRRILKRASFPDIELMNKAFSGEVKDELLDLKYKVKMIRNPDVRDFFMLGLLSILESVSNTSKDGGFLRISKKNVSGKDVFPKYLSRIETMIDDVERASDIFKFPRTKVDARLADSRKLSIRRKFDAIITSPPYPNRHDYTRIYGLELIFNFIRDNDELKQIRYNTLRSHVEARRRFEATSYTEPAIINKIINRVKSAGLNNSKVTEMISGYFEDMFLSLSQMQRCLKKNGKLALVVSNVRFGGVNIPVDKLLAQIGEQTGLRTEAILTARYRGNSAQQMGRFKRKPSRESIVIWGNP